jgi:hypothetical protein
MQTASRNRITDAIRAREDFTVNSMSGTRIGARYPIQVGQLKDKSPKDVERLTSAVARGDVTYVVYSYGTPIAWVEKGKGYAPDVKYSTTTSHHQTIARVALDA